MRLNPEAILLPTGTLLGRPEAKVKQGSTPCTNPLYHLRNQVHPTKLSCSFIQQICGELVLHTRYCAQSI